MFAANVRSPELFVVVVRLQDYCMAAGLRRLWTLELGNWKLYELAASQRINKCPCCIADGLR